MYRYAFNQAKSNGAANEKIVSQLALEFQLKEQQVENAIKLIDEGNTIPFISGTEKKPREDLMTVF